MINQESPDRRGNSWQSRASEAAEKASKEPLSLNLSPEEFIRIFNEHKNPIAMFSENSLLGGKEKRTELFENPALLRALVERHITVLEGSDTKMDSESAAAEYEALQKICKVLPREGAAALSIRFFHAVLISAESTVLTDTRVGEAANLVRQYSGNIDIITPSLKDYFDRRVKEIAFPRTFVEASLKQVGRGDPSLADIADLLNEDRSGILHFASMVAGITGKSFFSRNTERPSLQSKIDFALKLYQNTGIAELMRHVLLDPEAVKVLQNDNISSTAACELVRNDLQNEPLAYVPYGRERKPNDEVYLAINYNLNTPKLTPEDRTKLAERALLFHSADQAKAVCDRYLPPESIIPYQGLLKLLSEGKLEQADAVSKVFGMPIGPAELTHAVAHLNDRKQGYQEKNNLLGVFEVERMRFALDDYVKRGISASSVPNFDLPPDYQGKILLIQWRNDLYIRGNAKWHRDILANFKQELVIRGFSMLTDWPDQMGGAHINVDNEGRLAIFGRSEDYGECNKDVALEIIKKGVPEREVVKANLF